MSISPYFRMAGDEARGLLFGLMEADKIQLRKYPDMPSMRELIRDGRVKYDAYDPQEHWKTYRELVDEVQQNGTAYGDCEELAVAVAAEDQVRYGVQSLPFAYTPRPGLFHVVTAVPDGAAPSSMSPKQVVSGEERGQIPFGFEQWPVAMGAHSISGYVLQDPSRAAGMGSYGYAPDEGVSRSRYGGMSMAYGAQGRGIGGAFRSFKEGLLGGDTTRSALSELGAGVRRGSGLGEGWAGRIGEQIPGSLGIGGKVKPKEESAAKALRKGMDQEEHDEPSDVEDEEDSDLDDMDSSDEEEFGGIDDAVLSEMFGATLDADDDYSTGLFTEDELSEVDEWSPEGWDLTYRSQLKPWVLPTAVGVGAGLAGLGLGALLSKKGKKKKADPEKVSGIDDAVLSEMFGVNPYYLEDGTRSEFGFDDEGDDFDLDMIDVDDDEDDEDEDDEDDDDDDGPSKKDLRRTKKGLRRLGKQFGETSRDLSRSHGLRPGKPAMSQDPMEALRRKHRFEQQQLRDAIRSAKHGDDSFAGESSLRRTDLFGADFSFHLSEDDLLDED